MFRFGSWPQFNGRKVVLEDDERLSAAVPSLVPEGGCWQLAENTQTFAPLSIRNDGTMVIKGTLVMG